VKRRRNNSVWSGLRRWATAGAAAALLCAVVVWEQPAEAGGPLTVGGNFGTPGVPFVWSTASPISYHTDQGTLGSLSTTAADNLVRAAFDVWEGIGTANISFTRSGNLGMDVNGSNAMSFFNSVGCSQTFINAIVYDSNGGVIDAILGEGQSEEVLGFASPVCVSSANRYTRGVAVLNGRFIDPLAEPPDLSQNKYREVFIHEFGHLIGLDHSQANIEALDPALRTTDRLFGLPVMLPVLLSTTPARVDQPGFEALAPDDKAWVSALYPSGSFSSTYGHIEGKVLFSDGVTPVQGTNLVARLEDNGGTPEDESLRFVYSSTSGYLFSGNPGQTVTCTNPDSPTEATCTNFTSFGPGSVFGSRDAALIGFFRIPLEAGSYSVEVEAIDPDWVEGSAVGPLGADAGEQFPLPGLREFWDAGESNADNPLDSSLIAVTAGNVASRDLILNGTPPRFDSFESARLEWREPAPAWLRERRPPAFPVMG
jgi:hypothetical protein